MTILSCKSVWSSLERHCWSGLVRVQWRGDGDTACPILPRHQLICVALVADGIAFAIEVLQYEPAYPNTGNLNVGDDVTGAYTLNVMRATAIRRRLTGLCWTEGSRE